MCVYIYIYMCVCVRVRVHVCVLTVNKCIISYWPETHVVWVSFVYHRFMLKYIIVKAEIRCVRL